MNQFVVPSIDFIEYSRQLRRTVFSHTEWRKHREPTRLFRHLRTIGQSIIYRNIARPVRYVTFVALFTVLYNGFLRSFTQWSALSVMEPILSKLPMIGFPMAPFVLSSPMLGLLLGTSMLENQPIPPGSICCCDTSLIMIVFFRTTTVFRTNTSYKRWEEANFYWCKAKVQARNIVRLASAAMNRSNISKQRQKDDLKQLTLCLWAYLRTMKRQLSSKEEDEIAFLNDVHEKLPPRHATALLAARHRPIRALQDLSYAIENLNMNTFRKDELHEAVTSFEVGLGNMEQILASPVPLFYTRHTVRFLFSWLSLLPTALYSGIANPASPLWNSLLLVPIMYVLSMFLFGIDEIAMQCEEPFSIMPQQKFCDSTYKDCVEIASFEYEEEWNGANGAAMHLMNGSAHNRPPVPLLGDGAFALKSSAAQRLFGQINGESTVAHVPRSSSRVESLHHASSSSYGP